MRLALTSILLSLTIAGCSIYHVHSEDATTKYYESKRTANDVVYLENVEQDNEVIGYITVNAERRQKLNEVIEKMKREAAVMGADAVTNIQEDSTGEWKQLPRQDFIGNGYVRANFSASAIVLK